VKEFVNTGVRILYVIENRERFVLAALDVIQSLIILNEIIEVCQICQKILFFNVEIYESFRK
jgi:hypothetical protein